MRSKQGTRQVDVAQVLEKAAEDFETGRLQWIQGAGRRKEEEIHGVESACLMRAVGLHVFTVHGNLYRDAYEALIGAADGPPVLWNDTPGRTLGEVIDLLRGAAKDIRNEA